ncbi:PEP-CTERM sorting domain-containing protein [Luteolibacter algae]|uniref:PEP-CTERM sorting domain-containing protein n=2 Tax=Luteolibacter algae TaxID=454151 RepID=A0ABW5D6W2_9BACT
MKPYHTSLKSIAIVLAMTATSQAASTLHLAFGVDVNPTSSNLNNLRVRDLHDDHYHTFTQNNGLPGSHVPEPFSIIPGVETVTFNLAAMEISPYPNASYSTSLTPAGDFHLVLVSRNGIGSDNVNIGFWHGDHTHSMTAGSEEHLRTDEIHTIQFSFAPDAQQGDYSAVFKIVDENGNYGDSQLFTLNVKAVPEPSSALLICSALGLGLLRRSR